MRSPATSTSSTADLHPGARDVESVILLRAWPGERSAKLTPSAAEAWTDRGSRVWPSGQPGCRDHCLDRIGSGAAAFGNRPTVSRAPRLAAAPAERRAGCLQRAVEPV